MPALPFTTEPYTTQSQIWPPSGQHILAHFDDNSVIVYQASLPAIGLYAIEHGTFGGGVVRSISSL
jgi:hypothetical protein